MQFVHSRNRWDNPGKGFVSSFDVPLWSDLFWITGPDPHHPKEMHPYCLIWQICNIFLSEQHCIRDLVSSVAKQNDIPLNRETLDMFVLMVLYEACSPVSSSAAKAAVQLLFGRAHLVSKHWLFCYWKLRKESLLWNNEYRISLNKHPCSNKSTPPNKCPLPWP